MNKFYVVVLFTFMCGSSNLSDVGRIEVMLSGAASLPCNISRLSVSDVITLIIWYRNGTASPIYSVDMRERIDGQHWADGDTVAGRSYFNFDNMSLIINDVTVNDQALYKCRVDYKQTPTANFEIELFVIVPIENVTIVEAIVNSSEYVPEARVVYLPPVTEGSSLTATCVAIGGNPRPKVTWWRKDVLIDSTYESFSKSEARNLLWLDHIERKHSNDVLTCKAENSNLTSPISTSVAVNIYLGVQDIKFISEDVALHAGRSQEVACKARGSRPPANITWSKDSTILNGPTKYTVEPDGSSVSVLTFVPHETDAGKSLTCEALNLHVPHIKKTSTRILRINYAPVMHLSLGKNLNISSIREGMDVYLECVIRAVPPVNKIRWLHKNTPVVNNALTGVIISNQTLVLQSVTRQRGGQYRCAAANSEGESISSPFNLNIKYEPICEVNQQRVFGASRNEEIKITCNVDGNPSPDWFRWSFNNSMVRIVSVGNYTISNGSSVITYMPTSEAHYGTLLCSSRNEMGPQVVPCVFHVVSAGVPDAPENCTIINVTQTRVHIKCTKGFDGGLPQQYTCEVRKYNNNDDGVIITNVTNKTDAEFHVSGLEMRTSYKIIVFSSNVKGRSRNKVHINVTTLSSLSQHRKRISEDNYYSFFKSFSWLKMSTILIATVVLGMFIVALILWKLTKKRINKRKKKRSEENLSKTDISQNSLVISDDDRNPDLIPQHRDTTYPQINSISVQTPCFTDCSIPSVPIWEREEMLNPRLLEANRLEGIMAWQPGKWSNASVDSPVILVLPENVSLTAPKQQNAETQTPISPEIRKESTV